MIEIRKKKSYFKFIISDHLLFLPFQELINKDIMQCSEEKRNKYMEGTGVPQYNNSGYPKHQREDNCIFFQFFKAILACWTETPKERDRRLVRSVSTGFTVNL